MLDPISRNAINSMRRPLTIAALFGTLLINCCGAANAQLNNTATNPSNGPAQSGFIPFTPSPSVVPNTGSALPNPVPNLAAPSAPATQQMNATSLQGGRSANQSLQLSAPQTGIKPRVPY
jgi:hypothetical protein